MTTTELKKKVSDVASIIGIITGVTMFILYVGSMQYRITNVEKDQEDCVSKEEFVFMIDAINNQTQKLSDNQHSINKEQNKINNNLLIAIEKNTIELTNLKENNRDFLDYFKNYTKEYFKLRSK